MSIHDQLQNIKKCADNINVACILLMKAAWAAMNTQCAACKCHVPGTPRCENCVGAYKVMDAIDAELRMMESTH